MSGRTTCFVIMPSGNHGEYKDGPRESNFIYNHIIVPAVEAVYGKDKVDVIREADKVSSGAIDRRIVENTAHSDLSIVDITGQNPNVFLELGMRYALRRSTTILLRQDPTFIPFDITTYRCVEYDPKWDGAEAARTKITGAIQSALDAPAGMTDSLVYNVFPQLKVELSPGEAQSEIARMSWEEYWEELTKICDMLKERIDDGLYLPDVIIGLSNGGMMAADLISRRVLTGTPIISFWVNRWDRSGELFKNSINAAVIQALPGLGREGKRLEILMIDDIIASGNTIIAAFNFVEAHLKDVSAYFLPIFSRNEKYLDLVKERLIWLHPEFHQKFGENKARIQAIHATKHERLPYDKDIRSS